MGIHRYLIQVIIACLVLAVAACAPQNFPPPQKDKSKEILPLYDQLLVKSRDLINDRKHAKALKILDQAGEIAPKRPEWLYERGRALFFMDRFKESAAACRQALELDPRFYDAEALAWAARLEAAGGADVTRQMVRNEIDALHKASETDTRALMAACQGYELLKDLPSQQKLILKLADWSSSQDPQMQEQIADDLFEQIIQAKNDAPMQMKLMDAYIRNFPQRRFVEDIVSMLLNKKKETEKAPPGIMVSSMLETCPASRRINTGLAMWLISQNAASGEAIRLLQTSLTVAERHPEEKPPHFTDALWADERDREKDFIHYLLGRAWFNAGDLKKAGSELTAVAAKNRHWDKVYHFLGMIALKEGDHEKAISCFHRALEINGHQEETRTKLMSLLSTFHKYQGDPAGYFRKLSGGVYFEDVTQKAGLAGQKAGRVAWGDYNQDGFVDLLIDGHRLFRNTGSGAFIEVTGEAGLGSLTTPTGGVWGDYDNDGFLDIFMTDHSGNKLFRNTGKGGFVDMTGPGLGPVAPCQTEAAAWGDLNNDGFLDIYAANYERPGVMRALGVQDQLYRNNGNGTFSDISLNAGIITDEAMCGRGVTWTDVNRDGYQDIVVANYRLDPNFLWINSPSGKLSDQAEDFGVRGNNVEGAFGHSIGPASGDLNNDGVADLFITNLAHPRYIQYSDQDMLLFNQGAPGFHFSNRYAGSGIAFEETNSDPALADVDNDGDLDIYMTSIYPGRYSHLYLNDGKGGFTDATWIAGVSMENSWGAAFADYDNDGFADLVVASENGLHLFRNNRTSSHWIKIKLSDSNCNRFGIGALVTICYDRHRQIREIAAGRGTGSQDDAAVIFGLGNYSGPVKISAHTLCGDIMETAIPHPDQTVIFIQ